MDQTELLSFLLDVFDRQQLRYAIAGARASIAFGDVRSTNDIDVVVGLTPSNLILNRLA